WLRRAWELVKYGKGQRDVNRILVSGVSGPIGAALVPSLATGGAQVVRLVRGPRKNAEQISWNPLAAVPVADVSGFNAVIHLAGESVVGRWTEAKRKAIRESRVEGTRSLATALAKAEAKPGVLVCASAIGFYGDRAEEVLREESSGGKGFLPEVCREWEETSRIAANAGIRTVNIRIGMVLSAKGGALAKMLPPFKLGLGGRLGSGNQWMSWIHVDDIVGAIHHIMRVGSLSGPVNLVAPGPVRNKEFTRVLASVLRRPALFPVPAFAARLAFGEMADELLLASQHVEAAKLATSGYSFRFRELRAALEDLLG
ncbi:MAG TPA: TIGR01777 family oxidoreductase, partial [Bryobacteraceae bacterium]|nr:TIGR01777 family oxidoreductase [Bryobacteraceae bacterium]